MSGKAGFIVAAVVMLAALAGCADEAGKTDSDAFGLEQVDVDTSQLTGGIRGVVVDTAIRPIVGATLALLSGENTTSDADGIFTFGNLAPGTYFVQASAAGHFPAQSSTDVVAGEVATLRIALEIDTTLQPYYETIKFDGFIEASVSIVTFAVDLVTEELLNTSLCRCTLDFTIDDSVATIVYEAVWETTLPEPTGDDNLYYELFDSEVTHIESAFELSPILHHFDPEDVWPDVTDFRARLSGGAFWPNYQQPYEMFITLWHVGPAPDDWSFVATQEP